MMKKLLTLAAILLIGMNCTMAQKRCALPGDVIKLPTPHNKVLPGAINKSATVSYNSLSTVLTVKFCQISQSGTVEVYRDGAKVAGITTKGGTTFSCRLREYGAGNYAVIVSNGKTVVDSKNYIVK